MTGKNKKVEENEFFVDTWREEICLWDATSTVYKNRDAKFASMKVLMEKCEMTVLDLEVLLFPFLKLKVKNLSNTSGDIL